MQQDVTAHCINAFEGERVVTLLKVCNYSLLQ